MNVDPLDSKLEDPIERERVARIFEQGLGKVTGYVLPLRRIPTDQGTPRWTSQPWFLASEQMFLIPAIRRWDTACRSNLFPWTKPEDVCYSFDPDPFAKRDGFPQGRRAGPTFSLRRHVTDDPLPERSEAKPPEKGESAAWVARPALCVQPREGKLFVFMPPVEYLADYLDLVAAIEDTAAYLKMPVMLEGYAPPLDPRIRRAQGDARSRRDRSEHPSGGILGRAGANHRGALRSRAREPPGHGEIHAGWAAFRHRRRQPRGDRRPHSRGQPLSAPTRSAAQPGRLLAQPSFAVVSALGNVYRSHQPASPCGRGAHRFHLRTGDRLRPDSRTRVLPPFLRGWPIASSVTF